MSNDPQPQSSVIHLSSFGNALAAGAASTCTTFVSYPLDLVRTRFQVHDGHRTNLPKYRGVGHALRQIAQTEGLRGLYAGIGPSLVGAAVSWTVYMWGYSAIKTTFEEHNIEPRTPHILIAGVVSGAFTAALTNPVWVIKTRMQLQLVSHRPEHHYQNMWQGLGRMFREEGFRSFFKGVVPAIASSYHSAVQFGIYEYVTRWVLTESRSTVLTGPEAFLSGGLSKLGALLATQPLNVIKSRLQEQRNHTPDSHAKYNGVVDCVRRIWRHEGFFGFYKGMMPSIWRLGLSSSLFFLLLEKNKQFLVRFEWFQVEVPQHPLLQKQICK